jgi:SAM-dependent methyltransferase
MNDEQVAYWNGPAAQRWTAYQQVLDHAIRRFGDAALDAADVRSGERALDIGCGCGDTALALGARVGVSGSVLGLDLSERMLARAKERATGRANLEFRQGDAAVIALPADFDLLFSRFGVMFFDDPDAAFANLRRTLRWNGRLSFVAWRVFTDNPWAHLPVQAVNRLVPEVVPPTSPDIPGPYAFADRDKVARILSTAGFHSITIDRFDAEVELGGDLETAVDFAIQAGPVSRLLGAAGPELLAQARSELRSVLAPHRSNHGFALAGSSWIVTARV